MPSQVVHQAAEEIKAKLILRREGGEGATLIASSLSSVIAELDLIDYSNRQVRAAISHLHMNEVIRCGHPSQVEADIAHLDRGYKITILVK